MLRLAEIRIQNYKSCRDTRLELVAVTPLVGRNNSGKSNIMGAIKWFLRPEKLSESDFWSPTETVHVEGLLRGIDQQVLDRIEESHRQKIEPYVDGGQLRLRRSTNLGDKKVDLYLWDPKDKDWRRNPAGIPQAISRLFPEPVEVPAMQNVPSEVAKYKAGNTVQQLVSEIIKPVVAAHGADLRLLLA